MNPKNRNPGAKNRAGGCKSGLKYDSLLPYLFYIGKFINTISHHFNLVVKISKDTKMAFQLSRISRNVCVKATNIIRCSSI